MATPSRKQREGRSYRQRAVSGREAAKLAAKMSILIVQWHVTGLKTR